MAHGACRKCGNAIEECSCTGKCPARIYQLHAGGMVTGCDELDGRYYGCSLVAGHEGKH